MKYRRGDVIIVFFPFTSGTGAKVRPALVVQNDTNNRRLSNLIVAAITTTSHRSGEPTQFLVDLSTPVGLLLAWHTILSSLAKTWPQSTSHWFTARLVSFRLRLWPLLTAVSRRHLGSHELGAIHIDPEFQCQVVSAGWHWLCQCIADWPHDTNSDHSEVQLPTALAKPMAPQVLVFNTPFTSRTPEIVEFVRRTSLFDSATPPPSGGWPRTRRNTESQVLPRFG